MSEIILYQLHNRGSFKVSQKVCFLFLFYFILDALADVPGSKVWLH